MSRRPRVGVIGGTFDPIHIGHLAAARAASEAIDLDEVRFLPSRVPPHRRDGTAASGYHRFAMAALAVAGAPRWRVSDLELLRDGPSYTYDTLVALGETGLEPSQLFFVIGADAFAEIEAWSRYPAILDAAHFVVVERPGTDVDTLAARLPRLASRMTGPAGFEPGTSPRIVVLAADTPAVSSTQIRERLEARRPIDDLVPPPVAAYIDKHGLYTPHNEAGARVSGPGFSGR